MVIVISQAINESVEGQISHLIEHWITPSLNHCILSSIKQLINKETKLVKKRLIPWTLRRHQPRTVNRQYKILDQFLFLGNLPRFRKTDLGKKILASGSVCTVLGRCPRNVHGINRAWDTRTDLGFFKLCRGFRYVTSVWCCYITVLGLQITDTVITDLRIPFMALV